MNDQALRRTVPCPTCKGPSVYSPENPFRPFCSDRCKNLDFGAWANESFKMPTAPSSDDEIDHLDSATGSTAAGH